MTTRRSTGKTRVARAVWYARKGMVELRAAPLPRPQPGEAVVRSLFSGISRGTERLVFNGEVGRSEWERMRCPNQEGAFPFPVKYGYCATGVVEVGPGELVGRTVFCLHPHQDHFNAAVASLVPVPDGVPARRATLTANMETALNALWDAGAGPGDRIVVVGAGVLSEPGTLNIFAKVFARRAPKVYVSQLVARCAIPAAVVPGARDQVVYVVRVRLLQHFIGGDWSIEIFLVPPARNVHDRHCDLLKLIYQRLLLPELIVVGM